MNETPAIPFIDLQAQRAAISSRIDAAIGKVLEHGSYIMGPEVVALERQLSDFCGARHAISCANGTDALLLYLKAKNLQPGDAVLCPSFTFAATAEVIAHTQATAVFVDILEDTFNMDPASLQQGITRARELGLKPAGVITVDLFGLPADYDAIEPICQEHGLWLLCDSAQGFGSVYKGRKSGSIGEATTTSFFPAKPLGCYGDGGAIFTDDDELAAVIRSLRLHGQGRDKYDNIRVGLNSRLDTLQAAILIEKLVIFPEEIAARNRIANRYSSLLDNSVGTPRTPDGLTSIWAQYTIRVEPSLRAGLMQSLKEAGVPSVVYYALPVHRQGGYKHFPLAAPQLAVTDRMAESVLSLPMHPYLSGKDQDKIAGTITRFLSGCRDSSASG